MNESLTYKTEKRIYDFLPHKPESMAASLFIIGMAIYYMWRMVAITPQYDELYTYYTFISRGPVYAAIHWPLPNNHVGYSVLSALLDMFGNSFIGLRGVSYICAVSNLVLIYRICSKYYAHGLSFGAVLLYSAMQVVNEYSVQGRGYTLATTCFLLSIYAAGYICSANETSLFYYWTLSISFVLGLYTVPSSIYWVIPISFAIGAYLIINAYRSKGAWSRIKECIYFRKFRRFFIHGIIAALITVILYGIIWLAIGSNLLVKNADSQYYGLSHLGVLTKNPLRCLLTGIDYMLSQPYIQSLPAEEFRQKIFGWVMNLFNYMLPGFMAYLIGPVIMIALAAAVVECVKHFAYSRTVINLIMISNILLTGLMLIIQKKLPYLRVFSYGAFVVVLCFCTCLEMLINRLIRVYNARKIASGIKHAGSAPKESETAIKSDKKYLLFTDYVPVMLILILFVVRASSKDFSAQLGGRETEVFNTLYIADVTTRSNIAVLDCDQQYLLKFGWDIDCEKTDATGADCVIVDRNMMVPGYSGSDFWKFYQSYETMDWDYIDTMHEIYENENFILYVK